MFEFEDNHHRCPGCMKEKPEEPICPFCGFSENEVQNPPLLAFNTILAERYLIGKAREINSEGATYIGYDYENQNTVLIREYFPTGLCDREDGKNIRLIAGSEYAYNQGLMAFLELSRSLASMRELPALLPIYDIFESGGSAYRVSENLDSITLREFLLRNGGSLSWDQARPIFMPLLSAIAALHRANIIHGGLSPETIIIGRDGKLRLIGFCISDIRSSRTEFAPHLYPGFAAVEQYGFDGTSGEWTDVYSFTATLYRVLVGNPPPEATARVTNDRMIIPAAVAETLPAYVMDAMANALQILPEDRTQSMDELREELSASPTVTTRQNIAAGNRKAKSEEETELEEEHYAPQKRNSGKYTLLALLGTLAAVAVVGAILVFTVFRDDIFGPSDNSSSSMASRPDTQSELVIQPSSASPTLKSVPDFRNNKYSDILSNIDNTDNFTFEPPTYEFSKSARGIVISQTPKAGEAVAPGSKIKLVISAGPEDIKIPSIIGKTKEEAEYALLKAGIIVDDNTFQYKWDDTKEPKKVISCTPNQNSNIKWYESITVFINNYEPPVQSEDESSDYGE